MLGTDARIVEAGRDRMGLDDLAVVVLQDVTERAVQDARACRPERCGVPAGSMPSPAASTPISCDLGVVDERMKDADRVAAAADAGDDRVGQAARLLEDCSRASRPMTDWKSRTIVG